jgi:hypothetical protein
MKWAFLQLSNMYSDVPIKLRAAMEQPSESGPLTGINISVLQEDLRMGGKREKPEDIVLNRVS